MIESKINISLTDKEKLTPPTPDRYLPGVHTNKRVEAEKTARKAREAELASDTEALVANARGTIETIQPVSQPNLDSDEPRIIFPEPTKKSKWSLKNLFSRT